jgi:hypothetical protein
MTVSAHAATRFWAKVQRPYPQGCWLYRGGGNGRGYGLFYLRGRQRVMAHRFAWELTHGDIPDGQEVCHRCDTPRCVNPGHMFLGSHHDNLLDAVRKGRKRVWGLQKLNAEQVLQIRARAEAGELHRLIAADFGIARHSVGQILNRRTWGHLPGDSAAGRLASWLQLGN